MNNVKVSTLIEQGYALSTLDVNLQRKLKAGEAFWSAEDASIVDSLNLPLEQMTLEQLLLVVQSLDRRFMQLWDKVNFERKYRLIDYSSLPWHSKPTYQYK